jgi:hypothetical protein
VFFDFDCSLIHLLTFHVICARCVITCTYDVHAPPHHHQPQAGLPLDKFWAVRSSASVGEEDGHVHVAVTKAASAHHDDVVVLVKVLRTKEVDFIDAVKEQQHLVEGEGRHRMVQERLDAIRGNGYLSVAIRYS